MNAFLGIGRALYWLIMVGLTGVLAVKATIPLLASWFGVTLTITGASPIAGMYLYFLASLVVAVGVALGLCVIGALIAFLVLVATSK